MYKRIIASFLAIATAVTLVAPIPAQAISPTELVYGLNDFFGWVDSMYSSLIRLDDYADASGFYDSLDRDTAAYCSLADSETNGRNPYHYWGGALLPSNQSCQYCGLSYSAYKDLLKRGYGGFTSSLPYGITASDQGVVAKGIGYTMSTSANNDFWKTVDLYRESHSASVGQFMLLGAHSSNTELYGLVLCQSPAGARYLRLATIDNVLPYTAPSLPLGKFVTVAGEYEILPDARYTSSHPWYRYNGYLSYADLMIDANAGIIPETCVYMTADSEVVGVGAGTDSVGDGHNKAITVTNCYRLDDYGVTITGPQTMSVAGQRSYSSGRRWYAANPLDYDCTSTYDSTTRPTSVMDVISKWNKDNSIGTNPININYYISPTGQDVTSDTLSNPSLYDEETMVFTDPVTGNQYLTSGWTYDYLTRCYTLTMADTFTIGETVIDTIKLTYGDEKLTIDHYSNGSLIQSDSYDYVMVSGSECSLNGHSYTYETIKQESCTSTGERKYTCSVCGDEYAETVPATEHPFTYTVAKPATCLSTGMGIYTCPDCGLQSTETIPKSGHSSVVIEVVPSEYDENGALISAGYTLYECTECGSQYTESEDVGVENESWFSWLGSLFKTLLSSIVNGLAAGLEWVIEEVLVTTVGWIIKAVEWVFGLFNGEHLTTLFNWFSFEHEAWANEFSDPALFKEVA